MRPARLEAWAFSRNGMAIGVLVLCRKHSDQVRSNLTEERAALAKLGIGFFRVRQATLRAALAEDERNGRTACVECGAEKGNAVRARLYAGGTIPEAILRQEGAKA